MDPDIPPPPPVHLGEQVRVRVLDIAFGGSGVARLGDFVLFIPFVAPDEEVTVEVTEIKRHYGRARLLEIHQASPHRVTAACRYFGQCGGCDYQHLAYPAQLDVKHKQIKDLFERIGRFPTATVDPVLPCPQPLGYRNRIMIRSQWNKLTQSLVIGYLRHDSGLVVDIEQCLIAEPCLSQQIPEVRRHPPPKGGIKVTLRLPPADWVVPRDSFFQNNFHLLPELTRVVRECLRQGQCRHLVDAYCGVGFFGIEAADLVESFVGIEYDHQAITAARQNALRRHRANGEFLRGTVEELLADVLRKFAPSRTALILDPPRRGAPRATLEFIRTQQPGQIIYVSCQPATLARDLEILCAEGAYVLKRVVPLDMFPQTQHVECVADLRATPGAPP